MAFDSKKLDYLNELEQLDDWTTLPDSDPRIIKLREIFGGAVEPKTQRKIRKKTNPKSRYQVKATKNGVSVTYEGVRHCAEELGLNLHNVYSSIATGYESNGYSFEKLSNTETLI